MNLRTHITHTWETAIVYPTKVKPLLGSFLATINHLEGWWSYKKNGQMAASMWICVPVLMLRRFDMNVSAVSWTTEFKNKTIYPPLKQPYILLKHRLTWTNCWVSKLWSNSMCCAPQLPSDILKQIEGTNASLNSSHFAIPDPWEWDSLPTFFLP